MTVGVMIEKQTRHVDETFLCGDVKGGCIHAIGEIHLRTLLQEQFGDVAVARNGCKIKRREALGGLGFDISAMAEEEVHQIGAL